MSKKFTKKELVAAYKELDKVVGVSPAIDYDDLSVEDFEKELHTTADDLIEPSDKFSKATQAIFDALKEKYGEDVSEEEEDEEVVKPVKKGKAKPEPEEEEEEDEEEEEEEEEDEEEEEEEEEDEEEEEEEVEEDVEPTLAEQIEVLDSRGDLLATYKANKESFPGLKTKSFDTVAKLKKAMLSLVKKPATPKKTSHLPINKGVGVIANIKKCIEDAGQEGISRERILSKLAKKFPDRQESGMKKTVYAQVPGQLTVHGWPVTKNKKGLFVKK
jgi:chemotaxis protein histidine kinase CheA